MIGGLYMVDFGEGVLKFGRCGSFVERAKKLERHANKRAVFGAWAGIVAGCSHKAESDLLRAAGRKFELINGREWFYGSADEGIVLLQDAIRAVGVIRHPYLATFQSIGDAKQLQRWLLRQLREQVLLSETPAKAAA